MLRAMVHRDDDLLEAMLEPTLFDKVKLGLDQLEADGNQLKVTNSHQSEIKAKMNMKLIDFSQIIGAEISRKKNKENKLKESFAAMFDLPNVRAYVPP